MSHHARRRLFLTGLVPALPALAAPQTSSFTVTGADAAPATETAPALASPILART